jgi:uncharacterized RDD family membrane protein YckC
MSDQIIDSEVQIDETEPFHEWAGFWIRVGATFVDFLALLPLYGLSMYNLFSIKSLPLEVVLLVALAVYKPFMEYKYGATLGKMALKLKVVNANYNTLSVKEAVLRYFPWMLAQVVSIYGTMLLFQHVDFDSTTGFMAVSNLQSTMLPKSIESIPSILIFISCLVVAFHPKKQGLHDLMAKTYCIKQ